MTTTAKRNRRTLKPEVATLESREVPATVDFVAGATAFVDSTAQIEMNYTARGYTGAFEVSLYRSSDAVLDRNDVKVGTTSFISRSPTASQVATYNFANPLGSDPQRPFFLVQINPNNTVPEPPALRSNNVWAFVAPYNRAFVTDAQFRDTSAGPVEIRNYLTRQGSYFRNLVLDLDNRYVDLSQVIADASRRYQVSARVLLATMEKESLAVSGGARPTTAAILGNSGRTWAGQVVEAARLYDQFQRQGESGVTTSAGYRRLVAKLTTDGVTVIPANNAVASLFSYAPVAGIRWGGRPVGMFRFVQVFRDIRL